MDTKDSTIRRRVVTILLCIVISAALTLLLASTLLRSLFYTKTRENLILRITNTGIKNADSTDEEPGTELEIRVIQGIDYSAIPQTDGWTVDGYSIRCERTEVPSTLEIPVADCSYIAMILVSRASAGQVIIETRAEETEQFDLYSPGWARVPWEYRVPRTWSLWENKTDVAALFALCLAVALCAVYFQSSVRDLSLTFQKLYHLGFFLIFGWIVAELWKRKAGEHPWQFLGVMAPFILCHFLLGWWSQREDKGAVSVFSKWLRRPKEQKTETGRKTGLTICDFLFVAGLCLMLLVQIYMGKQLAVNPGWDFGNVYRGALDIMSQGKLGDTNNCFVQYPNNLFAAVFLASVFKVVSMFREVTVFTGIWFNVMMIDLAVILLYVWMRQVWTPQKALYGGIICFFLSPYYLFVPVFYTDTLSLPFATGILCLYEWARHGEGRKGAWVRYGLTGVVCVEGYLLKGSMVVFAIAIVIHMLLRAGQERGFQKEGKKTVPVCLACFLAGCLFLLMGWKTVIPASHMVNYESRESLEFPAVQWLMMGMGSGGAWSGEDQVLATNTDTIAQRTQVCGWMLESRLQARGFCGTIRHFVNKAVNATWGDGLYFTYEKLKREPLTESWLHEYVLTSGSQFAKLSRWTTGFHMVMLLLMLVSVGRGIRSDTVDALALVRLIVLGIMLFLFIWETRSRYLVTVTPLFAVMTVDGSCALAGLAKTLLCGLKKKRR